MRPSRRSSRRGIDGLRLLALIGVSSAQAPGIAGAWEGWLVGEPCVAALQVADCPLRHVDRTVLLLENGEKLAFLWGEGRAVAPSDIDKAYAKRVRLTGDIERGLLVPVKMDVLETTAEKKFFKGCL